MQLHNNLQILTLLLSLVRTNRTGKLAFVMFEQLFKDKEPQLTELKAEIPRNGSSFGTAQNGSQPGAIPRISAMQSGLNPSSNGSKLGFDAAPATEAEAAR